MVRLCCRVLGVAVLLACAGGARGEGIWSLIIGAANAAPVRKEPETRVAATAPAVKPDEFVEATAETKPATGPATAPVIRLPPGKPWVVRLPTKGIEITLWAPDGWEKQMPSDKSPPVMYKQGKENDTHKAQWYFVIVEIKEDRPDRVLDRAILARTEGSKDFKIREQKVFKRADGRDAATMLFTATDKKGVMYASRETYAWVDATHLLISFEWAEVMSWRETARDMQAMTASVKVRTFPPVAGALSVTSEGKLLTPATTLPASTRPATSLPASATPILPPPRR